MGGIASRNRQGPPTRPARGTPHRQLDGRRAVRPLVPGLSDFVIEFMQEDACGPDGYLVEKGLIPLLADDRASVRAEALEALKLTDPKSPLPSERDQLPPQSDENLPG